MVHLLELGHLRIHIRIMAGLIMLLLKLLQAMHKILTVNYNQIMIPVLIFI